MNPATTPPPGPSATSAVGTPPPRLLDQRRQSASHRGHSSATTTAFVPWTRRYILFHGKRHPRDRSLASLGRFLEHLVQTEKEPLPALEAARTALDFLYREVLRIDLGELPQHRPPRLLDQVRQVLRVRHYALRTEELIPP